MPLSTVRAVGNLPTVKSLDERLLHETEKIIEAGHLRPAYTIAIEEYSWQSEPDKERNNNFDEVWHNPADMIYTLARIYPRLPDALYPHDPSRTWKEKVKQYMQSEFDTYKPYKFDFIGSEGTPREKNDVPNSLQNVFARDYYIQLQPTTISWKGWSFHPFNFYACASYANIMGNATGVLGLLRSNNHIPQALPADTAWLNTHPHVINSYIAGYYGYLDLQNAAREQPDAQVQNWLDVALTLRVNQLTTNPQDVDTFEAGGFLWLVPELGDYLASHAQAEVAATIVGHENLVPYWMVAKAEEAPRIYGYNEGSLSDYYQYSSLFNAKAYALKRHREELEQYLDVPAVERGDLFYIQNLVATIESSFTNTPISGDLNNDNTVNIQDIIILINEIFTPSGVQGLDINSDGKVDILDVIALINIIFD